MNKRDIFAEIGEGFDALKVERKRETTAHACMPEVAPTTVSPHGSRCECHGIGKVKVKVKKWL